MGEINYRLGLDDFVPVEGLVQYSSRTEGTCGTENGGKIMNRQALLHLYNIALALAVGTGFGVGIKAGIKSLENFLK